MNWRILAVDPGEKRIGLALSDPTGTIANPLGVLTHVSRKVDAASIVQVAMERGATRIIIGQALGDEGQETSQARHASRLAEAVRAQTNLPVDLWDESGSTLAARQSRIAMRVPRRKRSGHLDEIAATIILQTYLDAHPQASQPTMGEKNGEPQGGNFP